MKKSILFSSAVLMLSGAAFAQDYPESTSKSLYDFSPWDDDKVLRIFGEAFDQGLNYPTPEQWETIAMTSDIEFTRSHTRYRNIDQDETKDVVQDINHNRKLWCNFPGGYGKAGQGSAGYPRSDFDQDVFSMWNYTNLFGSWNYGFNLASGAWIDAAHKNGTRIYGGIKFFESWNDAGGSEAAFQRFVTTENPAGSQYKYKYSRAFVNAAAYFGNDGYNYNQEGSQWRTAGWRDFHAEVRNIARELEIEGFGIGQYTQQQSLSSNYISYLYGDKDNGVVFDCFLNYNGGDFAYSGVSTSLTQAQNQGLPLDNLYQGVWIVGISGRSWSEMNAASRRPINIVLWGEHDQSRFFQYRVGNSPINTQENYQLLLEKAFSGANRNPLQRPEVTNQWGSFQVASFADAPNQMNTSPGLASFVPERTAIVGQLPFESYFNLGNGENYFYKGKKTNGTWYNMSQQDIVPTYRWRVTKLGDMNAYANDIDVRFTHEDAYIGGSCLKFSGATTEGNDIVIYRTKLELTESDPVATVAVKLAEIGDSHLSVIVKKQGDDKWIETKFGTFYTKGWEERSFAIVGLNKGDIIEYIGVRINGQTDENYKVLLGKLKIEDSFSLAPASIKPESLIVDVKEENTSSLSVKLTWQPDYDNYETSVDKFGMVYNDEINVDHFEIFYKDGENGKAREVARTSQWAAYVPFITMEQSNQDAYIGVRAVSVDLKSYSPTVWVNIPRYEGDLPPLDEENPYGNTWMSAFGSGSWETITSYIYVEKVTTSGATGNLDYYVESNPAGNPGEFIVGKTQYSYAGEEHTLTIKQGETVELTIKGYNSSTGESLHYDFLKAYIDYDGNKSFLDANETVAEFGSLNSGTPAIKDPGVKATFTVPSDAHLGASRLRIVGSDAWMAHPGPTGGTNKGYSVDFPVMIIGDNTNDRQPALTYKDFQDEGEADEPEGILNGKDITDDPVVDPDPEDPDPEDPDPEDPDPDDPDGVVAVQQHTFASVELVGDIAVFTNTDKAWIYDVQGRVVMFVRDASQPADVANLAPGVYVVKMLNGQIVRSAKVTKK